MNKEQKIVPITVFPGILAAAYSLYLHLLLWVAASLAVRPMSGFSRLWTQLNCTRVPDSIYSQKHALVSRRASSGQSMLCTGLTHYSTELYLQQVWGEQYP